MYIEHIAIWTHQLEVLRDFYCKYFNAKSNSKYVNPAKKFTSYFLTFDSGARLEIMQMEGIHRNPLIPNQNTGIVHFAMQMDSKDAIDRMTENLRSEGITIFSEARTTGDGYYESVIQDPDGNLIELATKL
ncbi:MAG: VOC family protein [Cyclobacteriaceae bacterium]